MFLLAWRFAVEIMRYAADQSEERRLALFSVFAPMQFIFSGRLTNTRDPWCWRRCRSSSAWS